MTDINSETVERQGYKKTKLGWIPVDWKEGKVYTCFQICNSGRKPISKELRKEIQGIYPYYGPTKIQDYIDEYQYEGKYALIAEDGDHFLKYSTHPMTQIADGKFNVNNHAHVLKGINGTSTTDWFYWFFYSRNIYSHITRQGAGRYKLNKKDLSQLPVVLPPLPEQQKIAKILSTWDKGIEKLKALIEAKEARKKGLMQQLLTGKVRLKGFEGKWSIAKFKDIYSPKKKKAGNEKFRILSLTLNGIVAQSDYFKKKIASSDTSKYLVIARGDMVMSGLNFWMGSIDVLHNFENGIVSPAYKVFEITNPEIDPGFMRYFVKSNIFLRALVGASVPGASIVRRNLDKITLEEWIFSLPPKEEQKAIGEIFDIIDKELLLLSEKFSQLETQKKGLMQQLLTGKTRVKLVH